ncbi:MAG: hypothetical protein GQ574_23880 [Crocinitomix sp.]|nr:hypothetical protein [Crocinitomix sp.]
MKLKFILGCIALMSSPFLVFSQDTSYTPMPETMALYYDFTGVHGADTALYGQSISNKVAAIAVQADEVMKGPLVIYTADAIHIFKEDRTRIAKIDTRTASFTGFYEVTALSHIGPALGYLAFLKNEGGEWRSSAESLLKHIRQLRAMNSVDLMHAGNTPSTTSHWLDRLNNPAWNPNKVNIKNMFDYACAMSGNYLQQVLSGDRELTSADVRNALLSNTEPMSDDYTISFNHIMIATFQLEGLSEFHRIYRSLKDVDVDWANARIIVRSPVGNNYGGGLSTWTNWTVQALNILAGKDDTGANIIDPNRLLIAAYSAEQNLALDAEGKLPISVYYYYTGQVFGALYSQTYTALQVFSDIPTLNRPERPAMPGDYGYSDASDVDHFVERLKYSFSVKTELLSNTIGFWMPNELAAKDYRPSQVDIPGLNAGLPEGILAYPSDAPVIAE